MVWNFGRSKSRQALWIERISSWPRGPTLNTASLCIWPSFSSCLSSKSPGCAARTGSSPNVTMFLLPFALVSRTLYFTSFTA